MLSFSYDLFTKCVKGTNTMLLYILKTFNNDSNFRNERKFNKYVKGKTRHFDVRRRHFLQLHNH